MKSFLKELVYWLTVATNVAFGIGMSTVILYSWKIIPVSETVLTGYQFVAVSSPFVVGLTLLRWLKKYPTQMTWLQSAYGVTAICTWIYASIVLIRFYSNEGTSTDVIAAILVAPIAPLAVLAIYLTIKAGKNRFET